MDTENNSRAELALPNPQSSPSVPESELSEIPLRDNTLLKKSPPQHTWLTFLKKEVEFLGFAISGFLSIISERKNSAYLVRGSLGANTGSSIAGGAGIVILIINLKRSLAFSDYSCEDMYDVDNCFVASFSTEIVAIILFLTILGFCSAVSLTVYGVGELKRRKVPEDRLYEELNIYSPIYSVLEERVEESPPTDS
ncbi:high affinity immunoglobulin epsilon receptor subunit beta isoform 3 [Daubentonia madagascariensis]